MTAIGDSTTPIRTRLERYLEDIVRPLMPQEQFSSLEWLIRRYAADQYNRGYLEASEHGRYR